MPSGLNEHEWMPRPGLCIRLPLIGRQRLRQRIGKFLAMERALCDVSARAFQKKHNVQLVVDGRNRLRYANAAGEVAPQREQRSQRRTQRGTGQLHYATATCGLFG